MVYEIADNANDAANQSQDSIGADATGSSLKEKTPVLNVLIVDDNEDAAKSMGALLTHYGYTVNIAFDGETGLDSLMKFSPNLVLLDIGLPGIDGYEVVKRMRKERGDSVTIVALTGFGQPGDKDQAKASGFDYHLTKPVRVSNIQEVIEKMAIAD